MGEIYNITHIKMACEDIFSNEINDNRVSYAMLNSEQIIYLAEKIACLPFEYQTVLISRMCFGFSEGEIETIYGIMNAKKVFASAHVILGYSLNLKDHERILYDDLKSACDRALSAFVGEIDRNSSNLPQFNNKNEIKKLIRRQGRTRSVKSYMKRASVVVVAAILCAIMALSVNAGLRNSFFKWLVKVYEEFTSFSVDAEAVTGDDGYISIDLTKVTLGYMPDGFTLSEEYSRPGQLASLYTSLDEKQIAIRAVAPGKGTLNVNTEDVPMETIMINGKEGLAWEINGFYNIIWEHNGYIFAVYSDIDFAITIKVAENIQF